ANCAKHNSKKTIFAERLRRLGESALRLFTARPRSVGLRRPAGAGRDVRRFRRRLRRPGSDITWPPSLIISDYQSTGQGNHVLSLCQAFSIKVRIFWEFAGDHSVEKQ